MDACAILLLGLSFGWFSWNGILFCCLFGAVLVCFGLHCVVGCCYLACSFAGVYVLRFAD